jgi:hypothetical protein
MGMKALSTLFSPSANAGKRPSILRTAHPAVLAAFSIGLLLTGWTAVAQENLCSMTATPNCATSLGHGHGRGNGHERVWLMTWAFAEAPVERADVRVKLRGRLLADAEKATNHYGTFPAPVRNASELDRRRGRLFVRVSISGGTTNGDPFSGHMTADVELTDPDHQILVVNPVTTLVSLVLDARPELKLDRAEAIVKRFLELPSNYSLGLALRQSSGYVSPFFSPVVFMEEAQAAGGLDDFEAQLLQELASPSAKHPFRPPHQVAAATGSAPAGTLQELLTARSDKHLLHPPKLLATTSAGASTPASDLTSGLYAAALDFTNSENVENLFGWAMTLTGIAPTSNTTQDDIDAVVNALADLQSSLDGLITQVNQLNALINSTGTKEEYTTIVVPAQMLAASITTAESNIATFAQNCTPAYVGWTPPDPNDQDWCDTWYPTYLSELQYSYEFSQLEVLETYIADNPTTHAEGMLHLYSLWLGQSKQFFRPADSTQMQNLYDYWDGVLTAAANLRMEFFHVQGDADSDFGQQQIIAFIGDPAASSTGAFQNYQTTNLSLMWPPVPLDPATQLPLVVVSTQDPNHSMWSLFPIVSPSNDVFEIAPQCYLFAPIPQAPPLPNYAGFGGWMLAGQPGWQAAVSLAPSGTQWHTWLTQQTETDDYKNPPSYDEMPSSPGFWDWTEHCPGQGIGVVGGVWTQTFYGDINGEGSWYLVDPINNRIETNNGSLGYHLFEWALRHPVAGEQYFWYQ